MAKYCTHCGGEMEDILVDPSNEGYSKFNNTTGEELILRVRRCKKLRNVLVRIIDFLSIGGTHRSYGIGTEPKNK